MTEKPPVLRMTRRFNASAERVFDAWIDPKTVSNWLFTSPGSERHDLKLDARVGGKWQITDRRSGKDYTASGEYLEVERPHRLVFTFAMLQFSPNSDRITVEIAPEGAGCVMTFTQEGVDIADELAKLPRGVEGGSEQGWRVMFAALAAELGATIEIPEGAEGPKAPTRIMVQYKVKADRVAENEAQIAQIFEQLSHEKPAGLHYAAFKLADGQSFLHISVEVPGAGPSLMELSAFKEFLAQVWDRCEEAPMPIGMQELGSYAFYGERR